MRPLQLDGRDGITGDAATGVPKGVSDRQQRRWPEVFVDVSLTDYLQRQWSHIQPLIIAQIELILLVMVLATLLGVGLGLLLWNRRLAGELAVGAAAAFLTLPSLAVMTLFLPIFGLGWTGTVVALVLYSQLPIIRNTIAGLRGVDPAVLESARGIGMAPARVLLKVQLPLAWPVIIAGVRVATMMAFGISAIAAYVSGPGLGDLIFTGLQRFGAVNSLNQAIVGGVGIAVLALLFDGAYVLIARLTVSRGIRA
jgi:osmoprotectant transport system permease protein